MEMERVAPGKVVSLAYTLTVDGQEVARTEANEPMEYLHGAQNILPGLEAALDGRSVGEQFSVTLPPDQAYGDYDEEDMEEIDREDVPGAEDLEVGMVVEVEDEDGYSYIAHVRSINSETILLDFNPPLAGKTLTYDVEVVGVREATEEELDHGHVHGGIWEEDDDEWEEDDEDWDEDEYVEEDEDETDSRNGR
jgi:FKBP-type peptidyl-prolyl cis-trans isomerase SlyD